MQITEVKLDNDIITAKFIYYSSHDNAENAQAILIPTNDKNQSGKHQHATLNHNRACQFKFSLSETFKNPTKHIYLRILVHAPESTGGSVVGGVQMLSTRFDIPKKESQK